MVRGWDGATIADVRDGSIGAVRSRAVTASSRLQVPLAFGETLRFASSVGADALRSVVGARSFLEVAADAIVRAPNAGRAPPQPGGAELLVAVGSPRITLSLEIVDPLVAAGTAPRVIFVLHGIRDTRASMAGWARRLASAGFRVVLVDLRGHGRSTGDVLSFGVREATDLRETLDRLAEKLGATEVGVAGFSYGAGVALQWAGQDPRVRAVLAVAPFASLRDVLRGYLPLPVSQAFLDRAFALAGARGGFDPSAASAAVQIAHTTAPVLLIHGAADARVPAAHSRRIRDARPEGTELVTVDGAGHRGVVTHPKSELERLLPAWFASRLAPAGCAATPPHKEPSGSPPPR